MQKTTPKSKNNEKVSRKNLIHVPTSAKQNGTCTQKSKYGNLPKIVRFLRQWTALKTTFYRWIHSLALTTISMIILFRKFKKVLENVCEDIPITFDSSSYRDSTDNSASDYHNPGL